MPSSLSLDKTNPRRISALVAFSFGRPVIPDALLPRVAELRLWEQPSLTDASEALRDITGNSELVPEDVVQQDLAQLVQHAILALSPRQVYLQWEVALNLLNRAPHLFAAGSLVPITVLWPRDTNSSRFSSYDVVAQMARDDETSHLNLRKDPHPVGVVSHQDMSRRAVQILALEGYRATIVGTTSAYDPENVQPYTRSSLVYRPYDLAARAHARLVGASHLRRLRH